LHSTSASPTKPGKQLHDIVLSGNVSTTLQAAFAAHGFVSMHGLRHVPLKQASLLAQSASTVHWGCTTIGAENK